MTQIQTASPQGYVLGAREGGRTRSGSGQKAKYSLRALFSQQQTFVRGASHAVSRFQWSAVCKSCCSAELSWPPPPSAMSIWCVIR
jgi:hypothetical protein